MKKLKSYRKEIKFEIGGADNIETLIKIADSPEGEELGWSSFKTSNAIGVTGGSKLQPFEREGKGLPTPNNELPKRELHFEFDLRFTLNESNDIELLIASKDWGTHFRYMLKGLGTEKANAAVIDFEKQISKVIKDSIYYHAWACYRKQDESTKIRNESYDKITCMLENHFKTLLKWKGEKIAEVREENGIEITTYEPIEGGRTKGTKNKVSSVTLKQIKNTISNFKYSETFPTQAIVARRLKTTPRTIQRCLKTAGITAKYNNFVHSILMEK